MGLLSCAGLLVAVLALGACTKEERPPLPPVCLEGAETVERALDAAPRPVRLDGTTPLSECIALARTDSELQNAGAVLTRVAERLEAPASRERRAALELGYLVGAARKGAGDNVGVQEELARRIEQSAALAADGPPAVARALAEGIRAGTETG